MNPYAFPGINKLDSIEDAAIDFFKVDPYSKNRSFNNCMVRYLVYYIGVNECKKTLEQLGLRYRQDHSTVLYGIRKISTYYHYDKELKKKINAILLKCGYNADQIDKLMQIKQQHENI